MNNKVSKEVKIGIAFLISIFLLYFGISFLKGINVFKPSNTYFVAFDDVTGLAKSTPVTLNGLNVGSVHSMVLDADNPARVITSISLHEEIKITEGSQITLDVSTLGNANLILKLNSQSRNYLDINDTIIGHRKKGLFDSVDKIGPQFEALLPKIDSILVGLQALVNDSSLNKSLANVNLITSDLSKATKTLDQTMTTLNRDIPTITQNMSTITNDISGVTQQLKEIDLVATHQSIDATAENLEYLSGKLKSKDSSIGLLLNDRQMYDSLNMTISNMSLLLKDLRENPQKYINVKIF